MNDLRNVTFQIDKKSWGAATVPVKIQRMEGQQQVDLLEVLLNIAWYNAPPRGYGFELAYGWSCLRYYPAFEPTARLCICEAYEELDPHQKTILSDDLGVGFGTYIVNRAFSPIAILPTLFFVKLLKYHGLNCCSLKSSSKTGGDKSPDFLAVTKSGLIHVLECKGTQTSTAYMRKAMKDGLDQKDSIKLQSKKIAGQRLVTGVFLPRTKNGHSDQTVCRIADPPVETEDNETIGDAHIEVGAALLRPGASGRADGECGLGVGGMYHHTSDPQHRDANGSTPSACRT